MGTTVADQGNDILVRQLGPDDRDAYFTLRLQGLKAHPEAFAVSYDEALQRGPSLHDATLQGTRTDEGDFLLGAFAGAGGPLVGIVGLFRAQRIKERHKAGVGETASSIGANGLFGRRAPLAISIRRSDAWFFLNG